jgi:hypothetical protein
MTSKPMALAASTRSRQSRKVEPLSPRPSAERGKNSYQAANRASRLSTVTLGYRGTARGKGGASTKAWVAGGSSQNSAASDKSG